MNDCLTAGFFGSGKFAADCLRLITGKVRPLWVITSEAKPAGRGMRERMTPVQKTALELGITLYTTDKIGRDEIRLAWIKENLPDVILVIDFGQMIKEPLLSMPRLGCLNIHPSLLPAYRGSAPIQRAIMDGLESTGVTIFRLDAGMDSGPVLAQRRVEIGFYDDSGSLQKKCSEVGCTLLNDYLCEIPASDWKFIPQNEYGVSLAPKIGRDEALIDWNQPAIKVFNRIRALYPSPVAYTIVKGKRLKILRACPEVGCGASATLAGAQNGSPVIACGEGLLRLELVQPENRSEMSAADWFRGARLKIGESIF